MISSFNFVSDMTKNNFCSNKLSYYSIDLFPFLDLREVTSEFETYTSDLKQTLCSCGKDHVHLKCPEDGLKWSVPVGCKSRYCSHCQKLKAIRMTKDLLPHFMKSKRVNMLTLSYPHTHKPTQADYEALTKNFRKLRDTMRKDLNRYRDNTGRMRYVKKTSNSYRKFMDKIVYAIETKFHPKGSPLYKRDPNTGKMQDTGETYSEDSWNLHLHCIYSGEYVRQKRLAKIWSKYYNLPYVQVDVKNIKKGLKTSLNYVLKYVAKGSDIPTDEAFYHYAFETRNIKLTYAFVGEKYSTKRKCTCPLCGATAIIDKYCDILFRVPENIQPFNPLGVEDKRIFSLFTELEKNIPKEMV